MIPAIISFIISYGDKAAWIAMSSGNEADINYAALAQLIERYTGYTFILNYWFVEEFFFIFLIGLAVWIGVSFSSELQHQKESGCGNLFVIRSDYKTYLRTTLLAQSLYIGTVIAALHAILFFLALIMGGTGSGGVVCGIGAAEFNAVPALGLVFLQTVLIALYAILINCIAALLNCFISNQYLLQSAVLVCFLIVPMLAALLIEHVSFRLANLISVFLPWQLLRGIEWGFQDRTLLIYYLVPIIVYPLLAIILYYVNTRKYSEDYL